MSARLAHIHRHPIKSIGREALDRVTLTPGEWLPWDRVWAVRHAQAKVTDGWGVKRNFLNAMQGPALMAVASALDEATGHVTLTHPDAEDIRVDPDSAEGRAALADWLAPFWPDPLPAITDVHRGGDAHLTDEPEPWISINNLSSHRAVQDRAGTDLSMHRWRGNLWLDGLGPWEEFEWIGKEIAIGATRLRVVERIERCKATLANPASGMRDVNTLELLTKWGHQDFGVFAEVIDGGEVSTGDAVDRLD